MNLNQPWPKVPWVGLLSHQIGFFYFSVSQGICCMRFSNALFVHILFFVFIVWISLLSNLFFRCCVLISPLCLSVCVFENTHTCTLSYSNKDKRDFLRWNNFRKFVQTSMVYFWNIYLCWKSLLFERSLPISISE